MHQTVRSPEKLTTVFFSVSCAGLLPLAEIVIHILTVMRLQVMSDQRLFESNQLEAPCPTSLKHLLRTFLLDASAAQSLWAMPQVFLLLVKSRLGQNMRHEFNLRYLQNGLLKLIMCLLFIFVSSTTTCTTSTVVLGNNWSLRNGDMKNEMVGVCECV